MSKMTRVITVDGPISDWSLPVPRTDLLTVSRDIRPFVVDEERMVYRWVVTTDISDLPKPIGDDELLEIASEHKRSTALQDSAIANWVLKAWDIICAVCALK